LEDIQTKLNKISSTYSLTQDISYIQTKINQAKLDENERFNDIEPEFIRAIESNPPSGFEIIHTDGIWYYQEKEGDKRKYEVLTSIIPGITNDEVIEIFRFTNPDESTTSDDEIVQLIQDKWLSEDGVDKKDTMDKMYRDYFEWMINNKLEDDIKKQVPDIYDQTKNIDKRHSESVVAHYDIANNLESIKIKIQKISQSDNLDLEKDLLKKIDDAIISEYDRYQTNKQYVYEVKKLQDILTEFDEEGKVKEFIYYACDFRGWYYQNKEAIERDIKIDEVCKKEDSYTNKN
jgi:hypothetical protein